MRFTKKELKRIIQEEYQKALEEYIPEGEDEGHYAKMRSQEKPTPDPFALTTIDKIRELLNNLETTLGAATVAEALDPETEESLISSIKANPGSNWLLAKGEGDPELGEAIKAIAEKLAGEESSPHPGGEPDVYAMMEED